MKVSKQKRVKLLDTSQKNETTAIVLDNEKNRAKGDRNTIRRMRKNAQK